MILSLLIILGLVYYVMTPEERARFLGPVAEVLRQLTDTAKARVKDAATQAVRQDRDREREPEPFRDALRARTPRALVTPALVALNATIFVFMLFGAGALSDPETLIGWGANFGPRTTNGEWTRLVTAMFVHSGMLHLLANLACLVQLGLILERLVGHLAFAAVYAAAGLLAGLVSVSASPVAVSIGASGAIFGVYGLLLASLFWGTLHRSTVTIPPMALKRLGPATAVFILYSVATDRMGFAAELAGLVAGFACGLVLARGVSDRKPPARRVAVAMAATVVIAVVFAVPLRGLSDVRPEIEGVIAVEDRTAAAYSTAVDRFRKGRITATALAQLIDRTILPEVRAARARVEALDRVPAQHQPLVASAEEYLRLREQSWRLRAEALHKGSMRTLREADKTERASLDAFEKIRSADQK